MFRGLFNFINKSSGYNESIKRWYVHNQSTTMIWYDMVVNDYPGFDNRKQILQQIKDLKKNINNNVKKPFIYFICARTKIRFSKNVKLIREGTKTKIALEIGAKKYKRNIVVENITCNSQYPISVEILHSGKFISFFYEDIKPVVMSVHDFLLNFKVKLGINSRVLYVGLTERPEKRPLDGLHTGLSEILLNISNEDNDIIFFINTFNVISLAENSPHMLTFAVANSMIDEIDLKKEGDIIEKCFIFYFDSLNQYKNRKVEKSQMENNLGKLVENNHITQVEVAFQVDDESEYYSFFSDRKKANHIHTFTIKMQNGLSILDSSDIYEKQIKPYEGFFN